MSNKIVGAAMVVVGAACIKLYGDYKYYCGRVDCHEFYKPIVDGMHGYIKDLCNRLKEKEEA